MKKYDDSLFPIGQITKILGVTRKTLLVFEQAGLLTPAVKDEASGYRYYSADNMTQIRSIRALQQLGLSLKEIRDYYYDTENIHIYLQKLMDLRAGLDRNIQLLQARAAKQGELTVSKTILPRQVCFCRRQSCDSVAQAADALRQTYIAAAHSGKMAADGRMFTLRMPSPDNVDLVCCIPVEEDFDGPERMEFAQVNALCIYYRGAYEGIGKPIQALAAYMKAHNIKAAGPFRSIYMEGPPNRGDNTADYITQVAVPIIE